MPLVKRTVEPIYIGRAPLDKQVKNELEGVVVNSLAGVIKQLSSMSRHAENLFGDLIMEANDIYQRSTSLNKRVEVLYHKTSQLDSTSKEEVKVEDFTIQNHFKSNRKEEQQVLDRRTLPLALNELYKRCTPPPDLNQFTPYREDSKDGLKFYTDPNYFYDLWVHNQKVLLEKKKKKGKKHRKRKANKPTKKVQAPVKKQYQAVDKEFMSEPGRAPPPPPSDPTHSHMESNIELSHSPAPSPHVQRPPSTQDHSFAQEHRPEAAPPPPPPPPPSNGQLAPPLAPPPPPAGGLGAPPPPPPPPPGPGPMNDYNNHNQMSNSPQLSHYPPQPPPAAPPYSQGYGAPAPPPPPSVPMAPGAPPPPAPPPMMAAPPPPPYISAAPAPPPAKPVEDSRSALLSAIEIGKNLRKVERNDDMKQQEYGSDVASILARRVHIMVSDTESDSDGSESSDEDWSD